MARDGDTASVPSKSRIIEHWRTDRRLLDEAGFLPDWGEPTCWACDFGWNGRYDIKHRKATWLDCLRAWEKAPLQRCHIVPRSLGGSDHPANLFLLCAECHDLAPDTTDPRLFFRWVKSQNWLKRTFAKLEQAFEDYGLDTKDEDLMNRIADIVCSTAFRQWCKDNIGVHKLQLPPYGSTYSASTMVAAVLLHFEQAYDYAVLSEPVYAAPKQLRMHGR
jgi:5-methylcytosine-specific restriction endonuclease McrA